MLVNGRRTAFYHEIVKRKDTLQRIYDLPILENSLNYNYLSNILRVVIKCNKITFENFGLTFGKKYGQKCFVYLVIYALIIRRILAL